MSADLLRRAAEKLREHANGAPKGPWRVLYFGDKGYPQRVTNDEATVVAETFDGRPSWGPGASEFIALTHPPVALALAGWLDAEAQLYAPNVAAFAVAREVLREPGDPT